MENVFVALSNFPVVVPLKTCLVRGDTTTALTIGFVGLASFVSHLFENHKHGMPGLGVSPRTSYYLNRLDVLGCILTVCRFAYVYYHNYGGPIKGVDVFYLTLAFVALRISEYDKYNAGLKWRYVWTHSLWHVSIFLLMDRFLRTYMSS